MIKQLKEKIEIQYLNLNWNDYGQDPMNIGS